MAVTIGVVVPVLDAVGTVDAAIDSVRAELDQAAEVSRIVVVDGGSTDGTLRRLAARTDIELVHQVGRGLAAARNQGLSVLRIPTVVAASGPATDHGALGISVVDLVAFCDADDRWVAGGLGARLRYLRDHPTCGVVAGAVITRPVDGHRVPAARSAQIGRRLPGYTPGALLVRRSVFDAIGRFDVRLQIAADSGWLARLLESDVRFDLLDDVSLVKGLRSGSLSTDVERYRHELLTVVRHHLGSRRADDRGAS